MAHRTPHFAQVSVQKSPMVVHSLAASLVVAPPLQGKICGTKLLHFILHHHPGCKGAEGGPGMRASPLTARLWNIASGKLLWECFALGVRASWNVAKTWPTARPVPFFDSQWGVYERFQPQLTPYEVCTPVISPNWLPIRCVRTLSAKLTPYELCTPVISPTDVE